MQATLVYSDTRFVSIIIDGKITSGLDILGTLFQLEQNCSMLMSNKFNDYQKLPGGENNHKQCFCVAAMLFQKHYAFESNWDDLNDDQELWDRAVQEILDAYPEPFSLTIQDVANTSIEFL